MGREDSIKGLDYFPKMVNFYEDDKIFDLLDEYGPLGVTIYDCILSIVYANGYYANLSKDKLSRMVIRKIGNKWVKGQKVVVQVIDYCADLGLFHKDLMLQDIITSVGIQKRFYKVAVKLMKRRLYTDRYWLLDKNGQPLLKSPNFRLDSEETGIDSEESCQSSEDSTLKEKEIKEKETKEKESRQELDKKPVYAADEKLNQAVLDFVEYRNEIKKVLTDHALSLLLEKLDTMTSETDKKIEILNQSIINRWTGIYELHKEPPKAKAPAKNSFHNFNQRDTDYDAIIMDGMMEGEEHG